LDALVAFEGGLDAGSSLMQKWARRPYIVPDTLSLIIWFIAGVAGGNAAGDLLKGDYDLGVGNTIAGAIGGVVGALILQGLVPALSGFNFGPILGQAIGAAACGAVLTVIVSVVQTRRRKNR
jgi:uncharacterized membrane protein YeaQ/YmgE (transglycosylase-associated protein family)